MDNKPADQNEPQAQVSQEELEIRVNLDALTFGDLEMAMAAEGGQDVPVKELLPFLNRVVVGGVKTIPVTAMPQIMDALAKALGSMANPKN